MVVEAQSDDLKPQSRRPSVVFLGSWPPIPGISSYCVQCVYSLASLLFVRVLTFHKMYPDWLYPGGPVPMDQTFPMRDDPYVQVHRSLSWYNPFGWIWSGLRVRGDLLHVQFWSLPVAPILATVMLFFRLRGKPCLLTAHNLAGHESSRAYRWATWLLARLSHRVIVLVPNAPDDFRRLCRRATGKDPVYIPHGPLDLYRIQRSPTPTLHLPPGSKAILFFGAIRPYKGLDTLIEAFGRLAPGLPNLHLVIAGRCWEDWIRYEAMIAVHPWADRVHRRLEYIQTADVKGYFDACDLVVLPYRQFESQSGVALSAAGMGKPMIVTDVGGLPSLQPDRDYVVPSGDAERLAGAIQRALDTPGELDRLTLLSRQVAEEHSWERATRETVQLYQSLLRDDEE